VGYLLGEGYVVEGGGGVKDDGGSEGEEERKEGESTSHRSGNKNESRRNVKYSSVNYPRNVFSSCLDLSPAARTKTTPKPAPFPHP
jgi:hypothetical protein